MSSGPDRRLHPISLVLDLVKHVRDLLVPLLVVVFAARSGGKYAAIAPAIIVTIAGVRAAANYFSYRYRYDDADLVIRSGMLFRNERHIPYNRIQNIDAVQNVVHRYFGVAVVLVQTGSGKEPEATMRVLPMSALADMRARVFAERVAPPDSATAVDMASTEVAAPARPVPARLLHLSSRDLVIAGFIENRGMALVLAAFGLIWQFDPLEKLLVDRIAGWVGGWAPGSVEAQMVGGAGSLILVGTTVIIALLLFVRGLSTIWAMIRLHDFTLVRDGDDLRTEYGLFTRVTATIPIRRVQTISVHERVLHRRLGLAAIRVTTAGGGAVAVDGETSVEREWLAPLIDRAKVRALVQEIDPTLEIGDFEWKPPHPLAVRRLLRVSLAGALIAAGASALAIGAWSIVLALPLAGLCVLWSRGVVRNLGYAFAGDRIAFRSGWLHRVTTVTALERVQSIGLDQSLLDRRVAMATLAVDTAGMGSDVLRMPYLPAATASELHAALSASVIQTRFVW